MEKGSKEIEISKEGYNLQEIIELRHWLHQNPELSLKEFKTVAKIREFLTQNLKIKEENIKELAETGLILDLQGEGPEQGTAFKVALRSDHDALPIQEENPELPYQSKNENCAHSCGHDGHTACLISGLSLIMRNLDKIPKNKSVRFIFQPGEEGFRGALKMIEAGCLDEVGEIYGLHNRPIPGEKGHKIIVSEGTMHSHCNFFEIEVLPLLKFTLDHRQRRSWSQTL